MTERERARTIEALLDPSTEAAVRLDWQALADAGFSSMAAHSGASNRPHLTLLARRAPLPMPTGSIRMVPVPIVLGPPIIFGSGPRVVLARSLVPTEGLIALHAAVHRDAGHGNEAHTLPGRWIPHVTLARRLSVSDLAAALDLIGPGCDGVVAGLRRWDPESGIVTDIGPDDAITALGSPTDR